MALVACWRAIDKVPFSEMMMIYTLLLSYHRIMAAHTDIDFLDRPMGVSFYDERDDAIHHDYNICHADGFAIMKRKQYQLIFHFSIY